MRRTISTRFKSKHVYLVGLGVALLLVAFFIFAQIKTSVFVGKKWRTNIALHTSPQVVISVPASEEDGLVVVTLPDTALVDIPFGYGPYRMEVVWKLSEQEHKAYLYSEAIADVLSIKIHAVVGRAVAVAFNTDNFVDEFKTLFPLSQLTFDSELTKLNFFDRIILYWKVLRSTSNVRIFNTHLNARLFQDTTLADGTPVKKVITEGLKTFLEQKFEETQIRKDGLSIEVRNSTDAPGVGQKFAGIVANVGGNVIAIGNEKQQVPGCELLVKPSAKSALIVDYLEKEYGCGVKDSLETTGLDLELLVGKEFALRWENSTSY